MYHAQLNESDSSGFLSMPHSLVRGDGYSNT